MKTLVSILLVTFILYAELSYDFTGVLHKDDHLNFYFDEIQLSDGANRFLISQAYNNRNGNIDEIKIISFADSTYSLLLDLCCITSYQVLKTVSNGMRDIAIYQDDFSGSYEIDTIHFNGQTYSKPSTDVLSSEEALVVKLYADAINIISKNSNSIDDIYKECLKLYKAGHVKEAASVLYSIFNSSREKQITNSITVLNDLGFFLEQSDQHRKAIEVLENVVKQAPSRTVAYLNLGDAYLGAKDSTKALKNYTLYISQMKENGKESRIPRRVLEFSDYSNNIPFEEAEKHITATKEKDNSYEVFDKLGIDEALRDSLNRATNITRNKENVFSLAYHFTNDVFVDTLQLNGKNKYTVLKLRIHKKPYPNDFEDVLELITIRDMKKNTVMTNAYVSPYCGRAEPRVDITEIRDGIYGINVLASTSCGNQIGTEKYCDTLFVEKNRLLFKRDELAVSSDAFNIFDKLEEFNND